MAHIRDDSGSVRDLYERLCKEIGHAKVGDLTGRYVDGIWRPKSVSTVKAYCNPANRRQVPEADLRVLDRYLVIDLKREPLFFDNGKRKARRFSVTRLCA